MFDPGVVDPTVSLPRRPGGRRPALEFGVGTGRIALPLSRRGVPVHGIDISEAMVAKLRGKPGADAVGVDHRRLPRRPRSRARSALAYLVFNTIMNLTTQEEQVACFENAAGHLESGGCS